MTENVMNASAAIYARYNHLCEGLRKDDSNIEQPIQFELKFSNFVIERKKS